MVFRYADDDTAMRNRAVVALTDAVARGVEVAATFGLAASSSLPGCERGPGETGGRPGW